MPEETRERTKGPISPDVPEFRALAQAAGVAPSRLAGAFNDPERFFDHLTAEEFYRFRDGWMRLTALVWQMFPALVIAAAHIPEDIKRRL